MLVTLFHAFLAFAFTLLLSMSNVALFSILSEYLLCFFTSFSSNCLPWLCIILWIPRRWCYRRHPTICSHVIFSFIYIVSCFTSQNWNTEMHDHSARILFITPSWDIILNYTFKTSTIIYQRCFSFSLYFRLLFRTFELHAQLCPLN